MPNKHQLTYLITETKKPINSILDNTSNSKLKSLAEYLQNKLDYLEETWLDISEDSDQRGGGKTTREFVIEKQMKRVETALDNIKKRLQD